MDDLAVERVRVFFYLTTRSSITKLFAWGGGGEWRTCAMRDDEPRPVWMSLLITHFFFVASFYRDSSRVPFQQTPPDLDHTCSARTPSWLTCC